MAMKFNGSLKELKAALAARGVEGGWQKEPNGVRMMRHRSGFNLHFSKTTGTVWLDGKHDAVSYFQPRIGIILGRQGQTEALRRPDERQRDCHASEHDDDLPW